MMDAWRSLKTPIGWIRISVGQDAVTGIQFMDGPAGERKSSRLADEAAAQLNAYFSGKTKEFNLPVLFVGTAFEKDVFQALCRIPYGKTVSYRELAKMIGRPGAARPVGGACGKNRIAILVPCHRVIGSRGSLTGYGGGLFRKEWLLRHEGAF